MIISKLRLMSAAIVGAGVIGAGIAGFGLHPLVASAQPPKTSETATPRRDADKLRDARRRVAEAGVEAAQAKLVSAEKLAEVAREEFEAQRGLRAKNATTERDYRRATSQLAQATAGVAQAKANLVLAQRELVDMETELAGLKSASQAPAVDAAAIAAEKKNATAERDELLGKLADWEKQRTQLTIKARMEVAQAEEHLRAIEAGHQAEMQRLHERAAPVRDEVQRLRTEIQKIRERQANPADELPATKALQEQLDRIVGQMDRHQGEARDLDSRHGKERLAAREAAIQAEEQLNSLNRQLAGEERELLLRRAENSERLRRIRGAVAGVAASAEQRLTDIDRKLDQIARDLAEIRREVKK